MERSAYMTPQNTVHNVASVVWVAGGAAGALVIETKEGEYVRWEPVSDAAFDELVDGQSSFDGVLRRIARATTTTARSDEDVVVRRDPEATQVQLLEETANAVQNTVAGLSQSRWQVHDAVIQTAVADFDSVVEQLRKNPPTDDMTEYVTVSLLMRRETRTDYLRTIVEHQRRQPVVRDAFRPMVTEAVVTIAFGDTEALNERLEQYG